MTHPLRRSLSSAKGLSQDRSQDVAETLDPATIKAANCSDRPFNSVLDVQTLQILDSSDDCIKVLDLEGRILFMNRGGQALLGIQDITPLLNTCWVNFWQEEERQAAREAIAQAVTGEACSLQGYCPTLDGKPKWWDNKISPILGADGQVERLLCISRDITERRQIEDKRRQAEDQLRESEERYQAIINQAVTGVACTDLEGNLTLVNQKYCDITGYSTDELRQLKMQDITHPEDLPHNVELFIQMRTEGTPFEIEKRYIRKDGSIVWVNNSVYVICDRQGQPQSVVAIAVDITERKRAELNAELLAIVTQNLVEATCIEDIIQTVGEQLHRYLHISNCAFIEVNESANEATIHHSWHEADIPSLVGSYRLSEFVTGEFFQAAKRGRTIIVREVATDPRIADPQRFAVLNIGSFINVPLIRDDEWKFSLGIYHSTPYNWRSDEIELIRELANRIWTKLERTRIEIALRQNQDMFSALVSEAPFGVYMIDADFRFQQANQTAIAAFDMGSLIGRDLAEALRTIWQEPFATEAIHHFRHTLATGESFYSPPIVEPRADIAEIQSYDWQIHRITLSDARYGVVCYFYDLSEIKRAEEIIRRNAARDAFLVTLSDALRPLTDAIAIQATVNRVLGEHLQTNRVTYFEVHGANYVVEQDYVNGVEPSRGSHPIESFGAELLATYRSGRTAISTDVTTDSCLSSAQRSAYAGVQIAAYIGVPLVKQGEFVAGLAVHSATPRKWTAEEIALAEDVAERTWAAVERARAEAALRESEEKYRSLFESIDQGFCLLEVLFDANDKAYDYRYLEINEAFEQQSGLTDAVGKTIRELVPKLEPQWGECYEQVVKLREAVRFEADVPSMNRVFDIYAAPSGAPGQNLVSVLFTDITQRKRREANAAFLAEIGDDFSRLSTADEIMQTVGVKIGAYLKVTTCNFTDVDEAYDRVTVHHGWSSPEVPSTVGTFRLSQYLSKEFERASRAGETVVVCNTQTDPRTDAAGYAALNMHSFVTVPFHRNGQWTHYIAICDSQPRNWRADEIQLIEEIATRIFPRLERVRAEEALRESEAKYRSLFESIDQGFCLFELLFDASGKPIDYRFLDVNQAFEQQCGLADAVGKTILDLAPNFEPQWIERYAQVAKSGEAIRFEADVPSLNGIFDIYAFPSGAPGQNRVAALFDNITERKQAEAAIAADLRDTQLLRDLSVRLATEENVSALYQEITAAAITLTHADAGTVQILDETTQELVLLATQGFEQKMVDHFYRVNASSNTPCGIALRSSIRSFVDFDVPTSEDPDGSMRLHVEAGLLSAQSTPLISRSGKPMGMVSTHWRTHYRPSESELRFLDLLARQAADLIEQRQAEAQRKQLLEQEQAAREEAERANRIKDEFLAVLSHELRSPLNPILGWSKLLRGGKLDEEKTTQALATIERNAKLQSELIEDLLDVSRILRGKLHLNVAPVNLATTIRGAMETVRLAAEAKSMAVEAILSPDVGLVLGDSTRLQQVIWNLLSNAVKFTPERGQVTVRLECLASFAQITVSDTGQGIRPDFLPYVFDYFRQADGTTTRKFGGLGLGLAIVRHLVELHGGMVKADSLGEGQGATFTIRLPLMHAPSQANSDDRAPQQSLDLNGIKILIVDDEIDTRDLVAFVLTQQGSQVITATSAQEALLVLPQAKPDVLLSDIGMPEMDGYMLIQQVRALAPEQGGQTPAIALTAYAGDTNQQQVLAAGFQKHISKPIDPEALVQAIVRLIRST